MALRGNYLVVREHMDIACRELADASILDLLFSFEYFANAKLVLSYVSTQAEAGTRDIIERLLKEGRRVAVPREDVEKGLVFCEISSLDELVEGPHGVLEAPSGLPAVSAPEMVGSACLVPGLVFDAAGLRVSAGPLFDRFLMFYPGDKIGLARTFELSSNPLPYVEGTVPVDFIVSEGGIWTCR